MDHVYGYDGADELLDDTQSDHGSGTVQQQSSWDYDKAGNRLKEQLGTAVTGAAYNNLNQLTGRSGNGALMIEGTASEQATINVGGVQAKVDATNKFRATLQAIPGPTSIPITAKDRSGNQSTYHAGLTVPAGVTFLYDDNGNMTRDDTGRTFEWDAVNRMVAINSGTHRSEFTYNGAGQRTRITEKDGSLIIKDVFYVWDEATLKEERSLSSSLKRFFVNGEQIGSFNYFFTQDHLYSIREMTDTSGITHAQYDYNAWGLRTKQSGDMEADFAYTGHYWHNPSAICLTLHRQYSASFGRWLSRDPIAERGGVNIYAYVENQPLVLVDYLGLSGCCPKDEAKDAQKIKGEINNQVAKMNSEGFKPHGSTKKGANEAGSSCVDVNSRLRNSLSASKCWDCNLEHRSRFPGGGRDHWVVICKSKRRASRQMMFDFWGGSTTGEDPNGFRTTYPYEQPSD